MARARKKSPVAKKSGAFTLPTPEELQDAAATRAVVSARDNDYHPCRVQGLDYDLWASAVVDLSEEEHNPQRVARNRSRLVAKGYTKLTGEPIVDGFEESEVWVKSRKQHSADLEARRGKIRDYQRQGLMSDTATLKAEIRGPHGTSHA